MKNHTNTNRVRVIIKRLNRVAFSLSMIIILLAQAVPVMAQARHELELVRIGTFLATHDGDSVQDCGAHAVHMGLMHSLGTHTHYKDSSRTGVSTGIGLLSDLQTANTRIVTFFRSQTSSLSDESATCDVEAVIFKITTDSAGVVSHFEELRPPRTPLTAEGFSFYIGDFFNQSDVYLHFVADTTTLNLIPNSDRTSH